MWLTITIIAAVVISAVAGVILGYFVGVKKSGGLSEALRQKDMELLQKEAEISMKKADLMVAQKALEIERQSNEKMIEEIKCSSQLALDEAKKSTRRL